MSAYAKPVVLGVDGQAWKIHETAGVGIFIKLDDFEELIQAILLLQWEPILAARFGAHGRRYVMAQFSRAVKARQYLEVLGGLFKSCGTPGRRGRTG